MATESEGTRGENGTAEAAPNIPDHVLLRKVAKGSYGEIWLALSTLGHYRAVKIVRRSQLTNPRDYEREFNGVTNFEPVSREHEGFVDVLQVGRNDAAGYFYYIMELADDASQADRSNGATECRSDGRKGNQPGSPRHSTTPSLRPDSYTPLTLSHEIRARSPLPIDEVVRFGISLLEGLQYLHSRELIHRDIKPSNIIFVGGQPKLADVGMVAGLDDTLSLVGTFGYMPAEGPGSIQADIYSLGKVLYEAATGNDLQKFPDLPTQAGSDEIDPKVLELNEVILKACANQPDQRYQSAGEVLADLKSLQGGDSLVRIRARRQMFRRARVMVGVLLGIAAVACLWLFLWPPGKLNQEVSDRFDTAELDTNKWALLTNIWPSETRTQSQAPFSFTAVQSNGEIMLEAKAQLASANTISAGAWLDSRGDFRELGPCRIDVVLAGANQNGAVILSISDGSPPVDSQDSGAVRLLRIPRPEEEHSPNELVPLNYTEVRIKLFPDYMVAVVYPDANSTDKYEITKLDQLSGCLVGS